MPTPTPLFIAIDANVRQGTSAFVHTVRLAKRQVAINRPAEVAVTERLAALLLAAQYEGRLHWLLNHPDSRLSPSDISAIRKTRGLAAKWEELLRTSLAMRKSTQGGRPCKPHDIPAALNKVERRRYNEINRFNRDHLNPLIDIRNSLAHGEWNTALTKAADGINSDRSVRLRSITLFRVVILANMLDHLWRAHFDAQVTYYAFERDFDCHYRGMANASRRLERADEARWLEVMRHRYKGGRKARIELGTPPQVWWWRSGPAGHELLSTGFRHES
ncbi:hypothetical protein FJK98_30815 [Micromonospora sp. HM134]|uniref:hypothetical protein n=1 Tax=Micromonospora sp. HM134 TaxID=2583243 RepID=UPI0011986EE7|nr:hypothetical protein [Micromonospora sp. HM134]QDY11003.1 hypothetical protein FJK98_30815 [Micromonospora sp. HM134]